LDLLSASSSSSEERFLDCCRRSCIHS
jgi:hypothetical protein